MGTVFFNVRFQPLAVEYPPAVMTSGTTAITGQPYGNGTYIATGSSYYQNNSQYLYFKAFDKDNGVSFWHGNFPNYRTSLPYEWLGGTLATTPGVGNGEYLQLQFPTPTTVLSYQITTQNLFSVDYTHAPTVFALAGSNNGTTWTVVDSESGIVWTANGSQTFTVSSPSAYSYYRLVIFNLNGDQYASIGELRFYGY